MSDTQTTRIAIEFLTLAARQRRDDWAIARATIHGALGTYDGHTIHDWSDRGRLSVEPAKGSILHKETKDQILAEYHRVAVRDRYFAERELYGIWDVATCNDRAEPVKHYIVHRVRECHSTYERIAASSIGEALTMAERADGGRGEYCYGIMAADYAEARAAGISFFDGDGLLV